jgi:site-specific recombinase XerD
MANSKVYIDPKKIKKNGELSVYILVHVAYKSIKFSTGVSCKELDFDTKTCRISGNSKKVKDDNLIIESCLARMNEIFVRYRLQNIPLTAELLRNEWKNPTRRINFHAFLKEAIEERKPDIASGTYKNHKAFSVKIKQFRENLAFSEINADFIESFARWLKTKAGGSLDINTVHGQLRRFRVYMNVACRKGIITENPFSRVKLRKKQTDRVYLTKEELEKLWILYKGNKLSESQQSVLRHFLFMCFTGIRVSDLKLLTDNNVIGKMLVFSVFKTKNTKDSMIKVPLSKQALQLIVDESSRTSKLFDCISDQKMNEYIKKICLDHGIFKHVTNHTGRHTFATLWMKETRSLAVLQKLLGHSDIKETMIYVHVDDQMLLDDMTIFQNLFQNRLQPTTKNPGYNS